METTNVLSLLIDITFGLTGIIIGWVALRRKNLGEELPSPTFSLGELVATAFVLVTAFIGPNTLVIALTPGMPEMLVLTKYALIPSVFLIIAVYFIAKNKEWTRLTNRIVTGLWIGAVGTGFLDLIRLPGFHLGYMPGNMPRMFGVLITDNMAIGPTPVSDLIGSLYHYWVGACFGITLTLIGGKVKWWWGLIWGWIIEIGMMTTPPMVIAMDTGYFGVKFGPGLFVVSFLAHTLMGIVFGLLAQKYVQHKGSLLFNTLQLLKKNHSVE